MRDTSLNDKLFVITGPTASGKTAKAVALAKHLKGEIISADSRQLYRRMDLGTGKDLEEYEDVPYHLIDICEPGYKYNLFEYLRDYQIAYDSIRSREKATILCGGTGLYIESVLKGIQLPPVPENSELRKSLQSKSLEELTNILMQYKCLHNTTDIDTIKRAIRAIEIQDFYHRNPELEAKTEPNPINNAIIIGIDINRDSRRTRISQRLQSRLDNGMVDEVRNIINSGVSPEDLIYYGLEYKFLTQYIIGELSYNEMTTQLEIAIHQFAKRQMTWFRGMERRGFHINWIPYDISNEDFVNRVIEIAQKS